MLPADLKARVEAAAKDARRSLSQEIVATLAERYPEPPHPRGLFGEIYELMDFVESGATDEEKRAFLLSANKQIKASALAGWLELGLVEDPTRPGKLTVFMTSVDREK